MISSLSLRSRSATVRLVPLASLALLLAAAAAMAAAAVAVRPANPANPLAGSISSLAAAKAAADVGGGGDDDDDVDVWNGGAVRMADVLELRGRGWRNRDGDARFRWKCWIG